MQALPRRSLGWYLWAVVARWERVLASPPFRDTEALLALQQHTPDAAYMPGAALESHIRRCTFRRLIAIERTPAPVYDVECLFPDRLVPIPLGDLETARPICNSCTARPVFRPDED
jgi:hypothetical protein